MLLAAHLFQLLLFFTMILFCSIIVISFEMVADFSDDVVVSCVPSRTPREHIHTHTRLHWNTSVFHINLFLYGTCINDNTLTVDLHCIRKAQNISLEQIIQREIEAMKNALFYIIALNYVSLNCILECKSFVWICVAGLYYMTMYLKVNICLYIVCTQQQHTKSCTAVGRYYYMMSMLCASETQKTIC